MIPKANKRLRYTFLLIPMLAIMAAFPILVMPPEATTGGAFLAGKCYVGSCGMDIPLDIQLGILL